MICPACGSNVSDDKIVCPVCGGELSSTQRIPKTSGVWCPGCGALVPRGAEECPKCGHPVTLASQSKRQQRKLSIPDVDEDASHAVEEAEKEPESQLESALPEIGKSVESYAHENLPGTRRVLTTAFIALVLFGGSILLLTHPWDPNFLSTTFERDGDLSEMGNMEEIGTLSGQDTGVRETDAASTTYEIILSMYEQLGAYADELAENEQLYRDIAIDGSLEERRAAKDKLSELAINLSNLIVDMGQISGSNSIYAEDVSHLVTLANWLRNRVDSVSAAWDFSLQYEDATAVASDIRGFLAKTGSAEYLELFNRNYEEWKPQKRDS